MRNLSLFSLLSLFLIANSLASPAIAQTSNTTAIERYSDEGQRALAEGRYNDAEQAYEKLRELSPGTAEIHADLGAIYFNEKKFSLAAAALRQALKLNPTLQKAQALLAMSLSELGQYKDALPGLEREFHRSTDPVVKRACGLHLERAYTGLRRDDKAVEVALELTRLYPNDPEVLYHAGRLFGNFAYLSIKHLADVAPDSIWKHQAAAEAWESQGSYDLAIPEYREILRLDPRRPGIHYRLGRSLLARSLQASSQNDAAEAEKEFAAELDLDPTNATAAYELGESARNRGDMDDAAKFFRVALQHYPDFDQANLGLARVLLTQGKAAVAREFVQKAIAVNPTNEVAWYRLGQIERDLGNVAEQEKAFTEFQRLRQKSPEIEQTKAIFSPDEVTRQKAD
jgi:tetratricopeptide (TPR) repeat protein